MIKIILFSFLCLSLDSAAARISPRSDTVTKVSTEKATNDRKKADHDRGVKALEDMAAANESEDPVKAKSSSPASDRSKINTSIEESKNEKPQSWTYQLMFTNEGTDYLWEKSYASSTLVMGYAMASDAFRFSKYYVNKAYESTFKTTKPQEEPQVISDKTGAKIASVEKKSDDTNKDQNCDWDFKRPPRIIFGPGCRSDGQKLCRGTVRCGNKTRLVTCSEYFCRKDSAQSCLNEKNYSSKKALLEL